MSIRALDKSTIRSIHSGQVIVDIESITKELIENSLDASATFIELKLIDHGLHSIQIKDNGHGIEEADRESMAKHHYTSKIRKFEDIGSVDTFGFRGEALHSICAMAKSVSVTTKTEKDHIAKKYDLDSEGSLSNPQLANTIVDKGTAFSIVRPFLHLPVRRQVAQKNASANAKKIQELLVKYALVYPSVRFSFQDTPQTGGKSTVWIQSPTKDLEDTMSLVYGASQISMLEHLIETDSEYKELNIEMFIPKKDADPTIMLKNDRIFFYVNQRPINYAKSDLKGLVTTIKNRYKECLGLHEVKKTPFIYVHIQLPPDTYDVNVEPNKTVILFHDKQKVVSLAESMIEKIYPSRIDSFFRPVTRETKGAIPEKENMDWEPEQAKPLDEEPLFVKKNESALPATKVNVGLSKPSSTSNTPISKNPASILLGSKNIANPNPIQSKFKGVNPPKPVLSGFNSVSNSKPDPPSDRSKLGVDRSESFQSSRHQVASSPPKKATPDLTALTKLLQENSAHVHSAFKPHTGVRHRDPPIVSNAMIKSSIKSSEPISEDVDMLSDSEQSITTEKKSKRRKTESLINTQNECATIEVDKDAIYRNYTRRKERINQMYRIPIEDYLAIELEGSEFVQFLPHDNLWIFFIKGIRPMEDESVHKVKQIGILNKKEIQKHLAIKSLVKSYELKPRSTLKRPVQVQFKMTDPLCAKLISLENREMQVADDGHGNINTSFHEIMDNRVLQNGFRVRWRKELHSGSILVQFTGICSLGISYGPGDFRELLSDLDRRPQKVLHYLESMALENLPMEIEIDETQLKKTLEECQWQTMTGSDWKLGVIETKMIGCMLFTGQ
ncbi:hypothetical protein BY458DRAFT_515851 [Sporodiniella umbellata]|nr:hypothetical protein BY458DRAFT_515851 [Sporodiniella umbellata]